MTFHVDSAIRGATPGGSAVTNASGYGSVSLSVANVSVLVQVSVCVAPGNVPCAVFYANTVALGQQVLQQALGAGQISAGAAFQPVVVRVVDSAPSPHPVLAAPVSFLATVLRPGGTTPGVSTGDTTPGNPAMPVILKVTQSSTTTDANGLASFAATSGGFSAPLEVDVQAAAGTGAVLDSPLLLLPPLLNDAAASGSGGNVQRPVRERRSGSGIYLRLVRRGSEKER